MKLQAAARDDDDDEDNDNNNNNNIPWKHAHEKSTCYEALVLHFVHYHSSSFISTTSTAPVVHREERMVRSSCVAHVHYNNS
jgi:hypothetical protein